MLANFIQNSFGLDISERCFRLARLKKNGGQLFLDAYGEISVPPGIIKDGKFASQEKAVALFKKLLQNVVGAKSSSHYVAACLPEPKTFIKIINLTYPKNKNAVEEVIAEAKNHIPYPLEKTYLDWQFTDASKNKAIIAVCPKEIVDNFQTVLSSAGLTPAVLEVESMSLARALFKPNQQIDQATMVIDLGFSRTGLFIYKKNNIVANLSVAFASNELTKLLKSSLNLSLEEAETAKRKIGLSNDLAQGGVKKILAPVIAKLAEEIREAKYFYAEHVEPQGLISKIILTGNGSSLKNLAENLAEQTQTEVVIGNPLVNLTMGKLSLTEDKIQSYNAAIGLALRQFYP
ncbi:MAG: type IV pilus assembly protein PilM [Candidatus Komeilibacteria bacterium]|nr:type IV pilus assembly protein PilM [Candidatus Komeilibacteria bacterium]